MPNALQDIRVLQTPTFKSNDRGLMIFVLIFFRCGVYNCDLLKVFPIISEMLILSLDYLIAVGYQINVALGIFPKIDKRSLLNNCSLGENFKKLANTAISTSKNMWIRHVVYTS